MIFAPQMAPPVQAVSYVFFSRKCLKFRLKSFKNYKVKKLEFLF